MSDHGMADGGLAVCLDLAALGPQASVEQFVAASHGRLGAAVAATGGYMGLGARVCSADGDPLAGWRLVVHYGVGIHSREQIVAVERELIEETYLRDPVVQETVRDAGRTRIYLAPDPRAVPGQTQTLSAKYWSLLGLCDRSKLVYHVNPSLEIHMAFDRAVGSPPFEAGDMAQLEAVGRGLAPWARRLALLHGYLPGTAPLSGRERDVACQLLGHAPIKTIAGNLVMSEARAREIVRAVYHKLHVASRAELAATWAGEQAAPPVQLVAGTRVRATARSPRASGGTRTRSPRPA